MAIRSHSHSTVTFSFYARHTVFGACPCEENALKVRRSLPPPPPPAAWAAPEGTRCPYAHCIWPPNQLGCPGATGWELPGIESKSGGPNVPTADASRGGVHIAALEPTSDRPVSGLPQPPRAPWATRITWQPSRRRSSPTGRRRRRSTRASRTPIRCAPPHSDHCLGSPVFWVARHAGLTFRAASLSAEQVLLCAVHQVPAVPEGERR